MTFDKKNGRNPNLGFGMVPPNSKQSVRYEKAAKIVLIALNGDLELPYLTDGLSEVKGLCNRVLKQDQKDWFLVWLWMGLPDPRILRVVVSDIAEMRRELMQSNFVTAELISKRLQRLGLLTFLKNFNARQIPAGTEGRGFVYILSTRRDPKLLKIGQTTRDVVTRVNEINSSTGVVDPFGVRAVWWVYNSEQVERDIHRLLDQYRIRSDREFFDIDYKQVVELINEHLDREGSTVRRKGTIKNILSDKGFGFLESETADYFFHGKDLHGVALRDLTPGDGVLFDEVETATGLAAVNVRAVRPDKHL